MTTENTTRTSAGDVYTDTIQEVYRIYSFDTQGYQQLPYIVCAVAKHVDGHIEPIWHAGGDWEGVGDDTASAFGELDARVSSESARLAVGAEDLECWAEYVADDGARAWLMECVGKAQEAANCGGSR